jgi:hypothetical protein
MVEIIVVYMCVGKGGSLAKQGGVNEATQRWYICVRGQMDFVQCCGDRVLTEPRGSP